MPDFIPTQDLDLQAWLVNFVTVTNANLAPLGLVAADLTPITTGQTALSTAITDTIAKRAAFENAVQNKATQRRTTVTSVRTLVRRVQANPTVSNALKAQLGITVRDASPSASAPVPPVELTVRGLDTGTNVLTWKRGGNRQGTQYVIEARLGTATAWTLVDVVTATRFNHIDQTPGVRARYRIRARRAGQTSEPGPEASVYA